MARFRTRPVWLAVVVALGAAPPFAESSAQETADRTTVAGEAPATARRLEAADKLASEKKWAEAVEEYQRIIDDAGDDLVPLDGRHSLRARRACHLRLAALPPQALGVYRERTDVQAKKWLDAGTGSRDPRPLARLADEAFCSRHGDAALDRLGDLAFERGRFEEAESWWRLIVRPLAGPPPAEALTFPDPQVDVARVRAKQLLARWLRGERGRRDDELRSYRAAHPRAAGTLAGREGLYAETLAALAAVAEPPVHPAGDDWPSFGGDVSRNRVVPAEAAAPERVERMARHGPAFRFRLDTRAPVREDAPPPPVPHLLPGLTYGLAYHPVIVGRHAVAADARYVTAYDLRDGTSQVWFDLRDKFGAFPDPKGPAGDVRYTLTADGDRVFARLGAQQVRADAKPDELASYLVCLGTGPGTDGGRVRWVARPEAPRGTLAVFEGAPVVRDGSVYVVVTRFAGNQTVTAVHCYPADPDTDAPSPRWRRDVCTTQEVKGKDGRRRHHLLTVAGPHVVYATNAGAVVALDATTGVRAWAVRYPGRGTEVEDRRDPLAGRQVPSPRDLAPCLNADGRLFAAPLDYGRLLCLNPYTGRTLWERDGVEVVHLLGASDGKLVFTTPDSIRAVFTADGRDVPGWRQPDNGTGLASFGRGLLAGGVVYWPTARRVYVLSLEDGRPLDGFDPTRLHRLSPGHLAFGDGCLVVTGAEEMAVYSGQERQLSRRRQEVRERPRSAVARYRLALAEAAGGAHAEALAELGEVERLSRRGERWQGRPLSEWAGQARVEASLGLAAGDQEAKRWEAADAALRQAGEAAPGRAAEATERRAALWAEAGRPERAVAVWQEVLDNEDRRGGTVRDGRGHPQPAAAWAASRIATVVRGAGADAYDAVERRARALYSAPGAAAAEARERLASQFPNARATVTALLRLGHEHEKSGRPAAAARAYRAFLRNNAGGEGTDDHALALAGLARSYENQRHWAAAAEVWRRAAREHGGRTLASLDPGRTLTEFVTGRLKQPSFHSAGNGNPAAPALPLARSWETALRTDEVLLPAGCFVPGLLFAAPKGGAGSELVCRSAASGKLLWRQTLAFAVPLWSDTHADVVTVGGPDGVAGLSAEDGFLLWQIRSADFGGPRLELTGFQLSAGRLFFQHGGRRLFALDAESGQVRWGREAPAAGLGLGDPSGRFGPHYLAGPHGVVAQTSGGRRWVLDAATGETLDDSETPRGLWTCPPVSLAGGLVCVALDERRAVALDPRTGKESWSHDAGATTTLAGEPLQVVGGGEVLLVLTARNHGYGVQRLEVRTGTAAWPREQSVGADARAAPTLAPGGEAVYSVAGRVLRAHALRDGRPRWEQPLDGDGPWRLAVAGDAVAVYPAEAPAWRGEIRWSFAAAAWSFPTLAEDLTGRRFAVTWFDAGTGRPIQRLNFSGRQALARFGAELYPFSSDGFRRREAPPTVFVCADGVAVALEGRAWFATPGR